MRNIRLQHISIDHSITHCVLLLLYLLLNQRHEVVKAGIRDQHRRLEHEQILIRGSRRRNRGHVIPRSSRNVLRINQTPINSYFPGLENKRTLRCAGRNQRGAAGHSVLANIRCHGPSKRLLASVFGG